MTKLYNVTARVVDLVWAENEDEAYARLVSDLEAKGLEIMPDGNTAFVSEPVESMGWAGEPKVPAFKPGDTIVLLSGTSGEYLRTIERIGTRNGMPSYEYANSDWGYDVAELVDDVARLHEPEMT